ncbi:MAG: zinc-binding alcohol dehydrogenase family protein [Devosia sp.]|uniref:zinc-binding alcohol dehydrogenase family protein n=1 Tax=Devosia sp. TaxID=1871048 RepID=UPI0024C71E49|nr:zinc-binding alcohol dehydrogenase family protein [Devosia sp.]UYN99267.1 MAG: zinc-binding alcohol dehydrogenase family protein [Devosia sp.]
MRAIRCNAPGELELVDIDRPELQPGRVRVAISHVGICGTDYHIYEGKHPFLQYPRIMGHELSGRVIDANGAADFAAGDAVVINPYLACHACPACREGKTNCCETLTVLGVHGDGGMAEEIVLPAENLYRADGLSLRDAAMVEFLAIGAHAVRRTELQPGWRVLVVGGGPIGLGVAFFARIEGAEVTILDAAQDKLEAAEQFGFAGVLVGDRDGDAFRQAMGSGFDAVFDATGSIAAMNGAVAYCRNGGALTLVGVVKGTLNWEDPEIHRRELTIRASRNATRQDFEHVMDAIRAGKIPTDELATHATGFDAVPAKLPEWAKARQGLIKAIISL